MQNKMENEYNKTFYAQMTSTELKATNLTSAQEMVPYILKLFPNTTSVVDVGCGTGTWAFTFKNNGVETVLGIDGPWVDQAQLLIDEKEFKIHNFESLEVYSVSMRYNMAICLEMAEHLDEKYADILIESLTKLSDVVVFSAAIPHQGGVHHVNEQFQSYWKKKFEAKGYIALDLLRGSFADNEKVLIHYTQNILVYVKKSIENSELEKYYGIPFVTDFISPKMGLVRGSTDWKYLFYIQRKLIRTYIKKILIAIHILKQ